MINYSKLLDHFTGLTVYRLRSHVRRSVPNVGQAELDEIDVGVDHGQLADRLAAQQVGRARRVVVQELAEEHPT